MYINWSANKTIKIVTVVISLTPIRFIVSHFIGEPDEGGQVCLLS